MAATAMIHVRVDEETKREATEALEAMGLSLSDAVRVFLRRVATEKAVPFELKVPNAETQAAMEEARSMKTLRFTSAEVLFDELEKSKG